MIVGYTVGTFDLFHIGHLKMLNRARKLCDRLIVGVTSEDYMASYKTNPPIIPLHDRIEIIKSLRCVDDVFPVYDLDHAEICKKYGCSVYFIGDDWKGTEHFALQEKQILSAGCEVKYLPYTKRISSTKLRKQIKSSE